MAQVKASVANMLREVVEVVGMMGRCLVSHPA